LLVEHEGRVAIVGGSDVIQQRIDDISRQQLIQKRPWWMKDDKG
jgi:hypothetical protein